MKRSFIIALLLLGGLLVAAFALVPWYRQREAARQRELTNRLPEAAYEAVLNDPNLVLLSLDPSPSQEASGSNLFHDYPVLGETVVGQATSRQALAATLKRALAAWDSSYYACFNPRHGLRAIYGGHTFELLICFECGRLYVYSGRGEPVGKGLEGPAGPFNDLLIAAKVPMPSD